MKWYTRVRSDGVHEGWARGRAPREALPDGWWYVEDENPDTNARYMLQAGRLVRDTERENNEAAKEAARQQALKNAPAILESDEIKNHSDPVVRDMATILKASLGRST